MTLRALGPVDLDVHDVPELREVGTVDEPASRPKLLDATAYLAMLDEVRREVQGETPLGSRFLVESAKLNVSRARGAEAHAALLEAIGEHGWEAIRELMRWGWREVAAGRRKPVLQATVLTPGGLGALLEAHGRAQQDERERQALEERRVAEAPPSGAPLQGEAVGELLGGFLRDRYGGAT